MSSDIERAEDMRMDVGALMAAVASRGFRIVLVTLLLLVATAAILLLLPKAYESSVSLLVEARDNVYTPASMGSPVSAEAMMSSQIELIKSRDLLLEVVDQENLRSVPEFTNAGFSPIGFVLRLIGRGPEARSVDETVLGNLTDRMTVSRERDSAVISILVRSADSELAARLANSIAAAHVKRRGAQSLTDTAETTVWLQQEIDKLRTAVNAAETAVANYKVDNDLLVGSNNTPVTDQQLSVVSTQIVEAQQRKDDAEARSTMIRGLIASGQSLGGINDVRNSVVIQSLLQTKAGLQSELAQRSTTLLANHPTIKSLKAQIKEIGEQIATEADGDAGSLDAEAKVEADLEQRLRDNLSRAKLSAGTATRGTVTLDGLQREAKTQRDLLENYLAKYSEAVSRTASNSSLPDVRIIGEAAPSAEPASPKILLTLGAVGFVALALQIGAVLFGELMSGRALAERRMEHVGVEAAPVAQLDDDLAAYSEDIAADLADAPAEEASEVDRFALADEALDDDLEMAVAAGISPPPRRSNDDLAALSASVGAHQLRTVLLATIGEGGETLTVIDRLLEDALLSDLSAVVVDAASGEVSATPGLTDLAAERADYGDVVQRIDENFAEVPWGRVARLDSRSSRPLTLVEALADIYHVVIVDTGRVGDASSLPLFSGVRATIVLVASDTTGPVAIGAARREIAALGFEVGRVVSLPSIRADVA